MIINHKDKWAFVGVSKTGSTAIHRYFDWIPEDHLSFDKWHYTASQMEDDYPEVRDFYTFGFARNPWDRIASCYYEFSDSNSDHWEGNSELKEYKDFEQFVLDLERSEWYKKIRFAPCSSYLFFDALTPISHIARYENFDEEMHRIFKEIGMKYVPNDSRPRKSSRKYENYREEYSIAMKDVIQRLYSFDINNFKYVF